MKKFSVILQYLSRYRGKLVAYMIFNILSIIFGLISLGMLSPFLDILFPDKTALAHNTQGYDQYQCDWPVEKRTFARSAAV